MTFASSGKHFRQFHTCSSNAENLPPEFVNLCKHPDIQVFINSRTCRCFHPSGLSDTVCIHGYRLDTIFLNTGKRRERTGCKKVGSVTQSYGTASATGWLSTCLLFLDTPDSQLSICCRKTSGSPSDCRCSSLLCPCLSLLRRFT